MRTAAAPNSPAENKKYIFSGSSSETESSSHLLLHWSLEPSSPSPSEEEEEEEEESLEEEEEGRPVSRDGSTESATSAISGRLSYQDTQRRQLKIRTPTKSNN